MVKFLVALIAATGILSIINVLLVRNFPTNSFVYLIIFLTNIITIILVTSFFKKSEKEELEKEKKDKFEEISERSISIFIRILLYILPILALVGLYFVSVLDNKSAFGIEDANSWVSFILGIAAFVMSLITLWQSEGTYKKILDGLDELRKDTNDIKKNTDISKVIKESNKEFIKDLVPQGIVQYDTQDQQSSNVQNNNNNNNNNDHDHEIDFKKIMNSSQIWK